MRENQGLQIAVIVFASLTVVLCVTTYLYFDRADHERSRADRVAGSLAAAEHDRDRLTDETRQLRKIISEQAQATTAQLQAEHLRDAERIHPARPTVIRLRINVCSRVVNTLADVAERELRLHAELLDAREDLARQRELHETQVAMLDRQQRERESEFAAERAGQESQRAEAAERLANVAGVAERQAGEIQDARRRFDEMQSAARAQVRRWRSDYGIVRDRWEQTQADSFEVPDGRITVADARARTISVDLGSADGLMAGLSLKVYDADALHIAKAKAKGVVEITRVTGAHTADGRIVEDKVADPILSGDLLFTPLWQPGENRRFALAGVLDIDGDGDDDSATLRAMIEKTKGTIEAAVAADGRRTGKLTPATRYLVVGEAPSGAGSEAIESYGQLLREARELGIDQISPSKLLDLVGQGSGRVVRLGPERSRAATGRPERTPSAY